MFNPSMYAGETSTSDLDYNECNKPGELHKLAIRNKELILGIETSFNDTGAAVVKGTGEILSNLRSTFTDRYELEHAPIRAKEHHEEELPKVVEKALEESGKTINDIKAIAVAIGPGQLHSLQAGIAFA
jgi:N6-L-threonylcarbamoyladenine synthase